MDYLLLNLLYFFSPVGSPANVFIAGSFDLVVPNTRVVSVVRTVRVHGVATETVLSGLKMEPLVREKCVDSFDENSLRSVNG